MANESETITQTEHIPASAREVYDLLTNPEIHMAFSGAPATGGSKVGQDFTFWGGHIIGKHLELQPYRHIVQEWRSNDWPPDQPPSLLDFKLKEDAEGTEVTMVHSRLRPEQVERFRGGWNEHYWNRMKAHFKKK